MIEDSKKKNFPIKNRYDKKGKNDKATRETEGMIGKKNDVEVKNICIPQFNIKWNNN